MFLFLSSAVLEPSRKPTPRPPPPRRARRRPPQEAQTNYAISGYEQELAQLDKVSRDELVLSLRRQSKGFMRGTSKFRGVTRHQKGRWEARIGQLTGRKYRYLGLYDTEAEAAVVYDREAVRQRGLDAVTNFSITGRSIALVPSLCLVSHGDAF